MKYAFEMPGPRRADDYHLVCRVLKKTASESLHDAARRSLARPSNAWAAASAFLRFGRTRVHQWDAVHCAARLARRAGYR